MAQRNLQHFDHSYKGSLHTCSGQLYASVFGTFSFQKRECKVTCKGSHFEIVEEIGLTSTKKLEVPYNTVSFSPFLTNEIITISVVDYCSFLGSC